MTSQHNDDGPRQRARAAMAGYLRLLAACLEDEADLIERDAVRSDEVLRRFRDGVLALSLEDAPMDTLLERMLSGEPTPMPPRDGRPDGPRPAPDRGGSGTP